MKEVKKDIARVALPWIGGATLALVVACSSPAGGQPQAQQPTPSPAATSTGTTTTYKDISVEIEGQLFKLVNGASETAAAPGSASKIVTTYFGNEATGDVNGDGSPDTAFLITQSRGGSGTFYYVVVALRASGGYSGTNAVLLGDRIAPQMTQISGSDIIVSYADRKPGEPMTASPSVGVSMYLRVTGGRLVVVR